MMMSLLILGPRSPSKDIDVYLQPLIEELEELWVSGVKTLDIDEGWIFSNACCIAVDYQRFTGIW